MLVKPNLFFDGNAGEAIRFYHTVFGIEAQNVVRYGDYPQQPDTLPMNSEYAGRIANTRLSLGNSFFNLSAGNIPACKITFTNTGKATNSTTSL